MVSIGVYNKLKVTSCVPAGIYVDGVQFGELIILRKNVIGSPKSGDEVDAFLFTDTEGNVAASMKRPLAMPGEVALLEVKATVAGGALVDWGMSDLLFVPGKEQLQKMLKGYFYIVYVLYDSESQCVIGSTKLDKYLTFTPGRLHLNQEVELLICDKSELGYRAIIDNNGFGFLYSHDVFQELEIGEKTQGYIKNIREDGKVDLYLHKPGYSKITDISDQILAKIKSKGGFIGITDKSPAEEIYEMFGVSKKNYKKAVGGLYKKGLILIKENGIALV